MEVSGGIFWLDRGRWTFFMGGWRDIFHGWVGWVEAGGHFLWISGGMFLVGGVAGHFLWVGWGG